MLIGFVFISMTAYVQSQETLNVGQLQTIKSKHLSGERNYYIHLPDGYETSKANYPVLIILDGQRHFTSAVALQHSIGDQTDVPEMIIVGLENIYPRRRDIKWNKRDVFSAFISEELLPLIDKTYRTKQERIVFGWEQGSYMASYLLFHNPQLFDGAIASNGAYVDNKMIESLKHENVKKDHYLYLANSIQDIFTIDDTNDAISALSNNSYKKLLWKNDEFNNETHSSVPFLAMFHGLRFFYHNYNAYNFYSINQYENYGGIPAIKSYFKERAKRFGFSDKIDDATKNKLIWLAWKRDNFKYFDFFMNEFKDVLATKRYQSEYWQNRLGQYYLKYKVYDIAIEYFTRAIEMDEKSHRAFGGLGKAYLGKNDRVMAVINFHKAVEIAEKKEDKNLDEYKSMLKRSEQSEKSPQQ